MLNITVEGSVATFSIACKFMVVSAQFPKEGTFVWRVPVAGDTYINKQGVTRKREPIEYGKIDVDGILESADILEQLVIVKAPPWAHGSKIPDHAQAKEIMIKFEQGKEALWIQLRERSTGAGYLTYRQASTMVEAYDSRLGELWEKAYKAVMS